MLPARSYNENAWFKRIVSIELDVDHPNDYSKLESVFLEKSVI